jgi:hypothetical protein
MKIFEFINGRKLISPFMLRSPSIPITDEDDPQGAVTGSLHLKEGTTDVRGSKLFNLNVKAVSWPHEGRGLLHVLSPLLYTKEFRIRAAYGEYFLHRDESRMWLSQGQPSEVEGKQMLARLETGSDGIILDCSKYQVECEPGDIWEEVSRESDGRFIKANDVLRFGSYKVKVVDTVLTDESARQKAESSTMLKPFNSTPDDNDTQSEHTVALSEAPSTSGPVCRICFEPSDENQNILLSPCNCAGSLRYIHVDCLRRWLDGQLQVKQFENGGGSYLIRTIHCEICKSIYSKSVYESILIPRPKVPHIILEDSIIHSGPNHEPSSKIHIIPIVKGKPIRIGRSKENDVVLADISVSRIHATILLSDQGVKLVDLNSKFGTLIQLPNMIFHPANGQPLRVQIGSGLIELTVTPPGRLERILPDRFFQERGAVKLVRSKSPSERIVEADRLRRSRSQSNATPTSPAATINNSFVRSPVSFREVLIDDDEEGPPPPIDINQST